MKIVKADPKRYSSFLAKHPSARKHVHVWEITVSAAIWKKKQDILFSFPNAKTLANNRVRFKIEFNKYRIVAEVDYDIQLVEVRFIGTHKEYDLIDPTTI